MIGSSVSQPISIRSEMAKAIITAAARLPSATADRCGPSKPTEASASSAASLVHEITRQTVSLNAACPAKKRAVPPRIIQSIEA